MKYVIRVHPGEVLQDMIDDKGLSQSAIARHIGVDQSKINDICRKRRGVSAEMAVKLALAFGTDEDFWYDLQKQWELSQVDRTQIKIRKLSA